MAIKNSSFPLEPLTSVTPLDGRYRVRTEKLAQCVSEFALIKTRFEIEAKYLIALSDIGIIRKLSQKEKTNLYLLPEKITIKIAQKVKQLEEETRHDVKAMERVFRQLVHLTSLVDITEMIHIGLTSEDVNNLSYRLMLLRATRTVCIPELEKILKEIIEKADRFKHIPMLARTHGQPAVPTTLGKEYVVFAYRLFKELQLLNQQNLSGKLNGAVGNFNALSFTYPHVDWISFSQQFISSLELKPNLATTQINTYEDIIAFLQTLQRINGILIDFNQDMWRYISDEWIVQEVKKGEVGSSTMPHKVNPIDFENSEGNLGLSNALIEHFTRKLPISRLQRDLTDSTTIRNIGTILSYSYIGYTSIATGILRTRPNIEKIDKDLQKDWAILAEAAQTQLRKIGISDPYSLVAKITRGEKIEKSKWQSFVNSLPLKDKEKEKLLNLFPQTYVGLAEKITKKIIDEMQSKNKIIEITKKL